MRKVLLLILAAFSFGVGSARAATNELVLSSTNGSLAFSDSGSTIALGAAYHLTVVQGLQLGVGAELLRIGASGGSVTTAAVLFGPTLNFPFGGPMSDALFWNAGVGFSHVGSTRFLFQTTFGKRFHMVGPVTYRPAAGIQIVEGGSLTFLFHVLSFSVLF